MRSTLIAGGLAASAAVAVVLTVAHADPAPLPRANTPIEHVVVVFDENESFDHYFGTYPNAANPPGEPQFNGVAGDHAVDGLTGALLTANPNGVNPQRIDRPNALTCGMNHSYGAEQLAFHAGAMDRFPDNTGGGSCGPRGGNLVMDYFDGNTVTALWNLAQHFSLSDNFYGSGFGPSTPGAIELVSGQTHGITNVAAGENGTLIGDPNPELDDCGGGVTTSLTGRNVGDLMNAAHVTWGWFQGGFRPTSVDGSGTAGCGAAHLNIGNASVTDYSAHHEPFQYYATTANRHHTPPGSVAEIGHDGAANHQYDLVDFDAALTAGNLPQVSFLKAAQFEDGHPASSDPLDEQRWIARVLNALEQSPQWPTTAVFIAYDDSDGWYDHRFGGIRNSSNAASDGFTSAGVCDDGAGGPGAAGGFQDRCGFGPRLPLLVVSPYARINHVDQTQIEQTSILRFIEDNWSLGRVGLPGDVSAFDENPGSLNGMFDFGNGASTPKVYLDPATGQIVGSPPPGAVGPPAIATATPTPVVTPTATATPPPVVKPAPFKIKCGASGKGRKLTVSCTASGAGATTVKTTLKLTVQRSGKTVVTGKGTLSRGKVKLVLKPRHTLRRGTYTLRIAITRAGRTSNLKQTFRLK